MVDERRRFFRIDDVVGVSFRMLSDEEANTHAIENHTQVDAFSLISSYETKIENYLGQLRLQDPVVAAVLDNLNKKMNCVISQLELESRLVDRLAHKVQEVNISACGMGFTTDDELESGGTMSLNLILRPTNLHVNTFGTVVNCEPCNHSGGYYVRVNFHDMDPADQEILIQHIVKRQGSLMRDAREETEQHRELDSELRKGL